MKILLFVGAGASVELGVPAMRQLAFQFRDYLSHSGVAQALITALSSRIESGSFDFENVVDELDKLAGASEVAPHWGIQSPTAQSVDLSSIRDEAEWFVQHACERIDSTAARLLWTPFLRSCQGHDLTIATTNYDRAIELAARGLILPVSDGFSEFNGESAPWQGFSTTSPVTLLKLHGSTDWYRSDDQVWKLRHPMALFGNLSISVQDLKLQQSIVLPSREKSVTQFPFQELNLEFAKHAEKAEAAIYIGTSLRDPHIRAICQKHASRIPTFVVARSASTETSGLPETITSVRQSASWFLLSSLPRALRANDVEAFAKRLQSEREGTTGVLDLLIDAMDQTRSVPFRCTAIDKLAGVKVALDRSIVQEILQDSDPDVSKYGLGLIENSSDTDELVELAKKLAAERSGSGFSEETELLLKMLAGESG